MKDIPAMVWMIAVFIVSAAGILFYGRSGPDELPPSESAWIQIEQTRQNLRFRRISLAPGQKQEVVQPPYRTHLERLSDALESTVARYVIQVRPIRFIPKLDPWLERGMDVGLVDTKPNAPIGEVRIVALRRLENEP